MNASRHQPTPEIRQAICESIRKGASAVTAAVAAGVPEAVFEKWMRFGQARKPKAKYRDFYQAVRQAQAQAVCEAISRVREAALHGNEAVLEAYASSSEGAGNLRSTCGEAAGNRGPATSCDDETV